LNFHSLKSCEEDEVMRDVEVKRLLKDEGIGTYNFKKISLRLKPGAVPIFAKPWPVPIAFKNKIEKELNTLEENGVIQLVDNNEWSKPL